MQWEHNMDYQPRQQLANALDLSSRLAQKEQTKQQQQQRQSSLFNALCDTQDNRNQEHENDGDEDWRRYLVIFPRSTVMYFLEIEHWYTSDWANLWK